MKILHSLMYLFCQALVSIFSQENQLVKVSEGCLCPGDVVIYECTVNGGIGEAEITVWTGSVISAVCPNFINQVLLFHNRYSAPGGTSVVCNRGAIEARSVSVSNNRVYTSRIFITLTSEVFRKGYNIECDHDDGENNITVIGSLNITHGFSEQSIEPSSNVSWTSACLESTLVFIWSPYISDCSDFRYSINASSTCGTCPAVSVQNSITCTDAPLDGRTCILVIQTEVCGNIVVDSQQLLIDPLCPHSDNEGSTLLVTVLGTTLAMSLVVCIAVCTLLVIWRCKKSVNATASQQQERNLDYKNVDTNKNAAYGLPSSMTSTKVDTKENISYGLPSSMMSTNVDTKENISYGLPSSMMSTNVDTDENAAYGLSSTMKSTKRAQENYENTY